MATLRTVYSRAPESEAASKERFAVGLWARRITEFYTDQLAHWRDLSNGAGFLERRLAQPPRQPSNLLSSGVASALDQVFVQPTVFLKMLSLLERFRDRLAEDWPNVVDAAHNLSARDGAGGSFVGRASATLVRDLTEKLSRLSKLLERASDYYDRDFFANRGPGLCNLAAVICLRAQLGPLVSTLEGILATWAEGGLGFDSAPAKGHDVVGEAAAMEID